MKLKNIRTLTVTTTQDAPWTSISQLPDGATHQKPVNNRTVLADGPAFTPAGNAYAYAVTQPQQQQAPTRKKSQLAAAA